MGKILISWMAFKNDFKEKSGETGLIVNQEGTTFSFHRHFFDDYEKHLLLSSSKGDDTRMDFLLNSLSSSFPNHLVEPVYMDVKDVIDLEQILARIQPLLLSLKDKNIDLFISPGTPTMQTAWMLAHWTLNLKTRLIQVRPAQFTKKKKKPERIIINLDQNATTASVIIKQSIVDAPLDIFTDKKILKTASLVPIYEKAYQIAQARDATVLILGETGTGKEHIARFIHNKSARSEAPFWAVNCSAMDDQLLESRLFGFKKGAFTGADKNTAGIIEKAEGGTIFLDEIGDVSSYMQQALLRVLQEKEVSPIGGTPKKVNVRFIAATNKELLRLCEEEKFRWDLYYRLAVVDINLPSLQERGSKEIKELIHFFLKQKKKIFNVPKMLDISGPLMDKLLAYPFPGNIRELENLIERFYVLNSNGIVRSSDLPKRILNPQKKNSLLLNDIEKWHIEKVLKINDFNQLRTAKDLGIAYNTLRNKIKEYGIELKGETL